ncbi:alpha/beta fold hydrolase [Streptomyces phaeolivaceus]|uniref:Alpha/beta fold hydrolase n=1 Tax=Streptomyces phaeolivaceus TaxID=2653200 RepID=A0A5P8JWR2_9ACTN|nr:alpha/beta fold hydrolase [Streptomyces phaeolivaceus]QFQ95281.1 alpha/beta fold hydrolase [Streptomyces phaeolivaceus]
MEHGVLPRTLHVGAPSPHVDWSAGAVELPTETRGWPDAGRPRRAGVSSFGVSGTNAHLILEEPEEPEEPEAGADSGPPAEADQTRTWPTGVSWVLSGRSVDALRAQAARLAAHVRERPELTRAEVGAALARGRSVFEHRAVAIGADPTELVAGLTALAEGRPAPGLFHGRVTSDSRTVLVLSDHGLARDIDWAARLVLTSPAFSRRLAHCRRALAKVGDHALRGGAFPGSEPTVRWAVLVALAGVWRSTAYVRRRWSARVWARSRRPVCPARCRSRRARRRWRTASRLRVGRDEGVAMASTPLLFLHGYRHGSWCWSEVVAKVTAGGRRAAAVDMAGHGLYARRPACLSRRPFAPDAVATEVSPVADVDLDRAAGLLVSQVRQVGRGGPVTVVAHSMGGTVLTRAAQHAPELIEHMVYLTAFMPASDVPALAYIQSADNEGDLVGPSLRADPAVVGALRFDLASEDAAYRQQLRQAFFGDVDPVVADAALGLLSPDAPVGIALGATALTRDGWGSIPRTYVTCARDMAIRPPVQRGFIAEADAAFPDNPTSVAELDASHSPFLSMPDQVADIVTKTG